MTDDAIATAQSWIDAEDEWREIVVELFALGRRLSSAEHEDFEQALARVQIARKRHVASIRAWATTQ